MFLFSSAVTLFGNGEEALPELARKAQTSPVLQTVEGTSMVYYLSLPADWEPDRRWPVIVAVTGSNSNFPVLAKGYHGARGEMPFILVTPATVSSGSRISADRYPHLEVDELTRLAEADLPEQLAYDFQSLEHILADVRERFGGEDRVYLSGFSRGGTFAWHMALRHPGRLHAVFPTCAVYEPEEAALAKPGQPHSYPDLPVLALQGTKDSGRERFEADHALAKAVGEKLGMRNIRHVVTWRSHSWHHEEILLFCHGHYTGRQTTSPE